MILSNFEIHAVPYITRGKCKCGNYAKEVSNGIVGRAMFCPNCETVYELKMVKIPEKKISEEFLEQCRQEAQKDS